jgi:nucleotide-binding universal stress UspA family protein
MNAAEGPILIAYDGSDAARCAVVEAAKLMGSCPAIVVTVWEAGLAYATPAMPPDGMSMTPLMAPEVAHEVDQELHRQADGVAHTGAELARSLGLEAEPLSVPDDGDVAYTILNLARDRHAAAIVVGSRGLSGLRARLEGSTSKGLLKHAPCPVLVVHEPHEQHHSD